MDYDEESVERVEQAKSDLISAINQNDFPTLLQQYNNDISEKNTRTYEYIKHNIDTTTQRLLQLQESANNVNANITACLENENHLTPEEFFKTYNEDCSNSARALGLNLVAVGENKRNDVALKKYTELMNYFHGCISPNDPSPHICAGVAESTYQELQRIIPGIRANHLQIERELKQQILTLSECSYEHISVVTKKLQSEFSRAKACILDKINTAWL